MQENSSLQVTQIYRINELLTFHNYRRKTKYLPIHTYTPRHSPMYKYIYFKLLNNNDTIVSEYVPKGFSNYIKPYSNCNGN